MPDGDRFERRLRGKHWRKALHLARGDCHLDLIVDKLMSATSHALNTELNCPLLPDIYEAVCESVEAYSQRAQFPTAALTRDVDPFRDLVDKLENIKAANIGSAATQIACDSALKTYVDIELSNDPYTRPEIQAKFSGDVAFHLIDFKWLSRIRDNLFETTRRSHDEQTEWESSLKQTLQPQAHAMLAGLLKGKAPRSIRAPRRLTKRKETTIERLNEVLR